MGGIKHKAKDDSLLLLSGTKITLLIGLSERERERERIQILLHMETTIFLCWKKTVT